MDHRLWDCPGLAEERAAWLPSDVQKWAHKGVRKTLLAQMCLGAREWAEQQAATETIEQWGYRLETGELIVADSAAALKEATGLKEIFQHKHGDV